MNTHKSKSEKLNSEKIRLSNYEDCLYENKVSSIYNLLFDTRVIIDLGAKLGEISICFAKHHSCDIYAYESNSNYYNKFSEIIDTANIQNIRLYNNIEDLNNIKAELLRINLENNDNKLDELLSLGLLKYTPNVWIDCAEKQFISAYKYLRKLNYYLVRDYTKTYLFIHKNKLSKYNINHVYYANTIVKSDDEFEVKLLDYKELMDDNINQFVDKIAKLEDENRELLIKNRTIRREGNNYKTLYLQHIDARLYKAFNARAYRLKEKVLLAKIRIKRLPIVVKFVMSNMLLVNKLKIKTKIVKRVNTKNKTIKKMCDLNVMVIADEFTLNNLKGLFNIYLPNKSNFIEMLENNDIDVLLCESAWLANGKSWEHSISTFGFRDNSVLKILIRECKKRNVSTIFWNKEDPFHFDEFIESAKLFEHVFTTDTDSIKKYYDKGCMNVGYAPFFFRPQAFNPINNCVREDKVMFAGSYYSNNYYDRKEFMDLMPKVFGEYGLTIYDRNYKNYSVLQHYPKVFSDYIKGYISVDELPMAYKRFKIALNANSIIDSDTMLSRRVVELLASNTPIISSEAKSIRRLFDGIILSSNNEDDLSEEVNRLFADEDYYQEKALLGLRKVYKNYTNTIVVGNMFSAADLNFIKCNSTKISILAKCNSKEDVNRYIKLLKEQTYSELELIIFIEDIEKYLEYTESFKVYSIKDINSIKSLNLNYITVWNGISKCNNYLYEDMSNAISYCDDNTLITFNSGKEYTYLKSYNSDFFVVKVDDIKTKDIRHVLEKKIELEEGVKIFNVNNDVSLINL